MSYNIIPYRILPYHMLLHHTVTYHTIPYQIICTCIKCPFFALWQAFLFRPRIFSRALGCGARGGGACALRCNFWPRPGSEAHVLGVRSRASWLFFTGFLSAMPRRPGPWTPHNFSNSRPAAAASHRASSSQALYYAVAVQQQSQMELFPL